MIPTAGTPPRHRMLMLKLPSRNTPFFTPTVSKAALLACFSISWLMGLASYSLRSVSDIRNVGADGL